jgi:hypothetical protein
MISTITALKSSNMEIGHGDPPDGLEQRGWRWLGRVGRVVVLLDQLAGNPGEQYSTGEPKAGKEEQVGDNQRERHAHHDRHSATPEHRLSPLPGRQEVGSQPDDDCIVARKHQVKEDDLEDRTQIIKRHGPYLSSRKGPAFVDPLRPGREFAEPPRRLAPHSSNHGADRPIN